MRQFLWHARYVRYVRHARHFLRDASSSVLHDPNILVGFIDSQLYIRVRITHAARTPHSVIFEDHGLTDVAPDDNLREHLPKCQ